jgi:hypothetical protein
VEFLKPIKATNQTRLSFQPTDSGTEVRWVMSGQQKGLMGLMGKVLSMDRVDRGRPGQGPQPAHGRG